MSAPASAATKPSKLVPGVSKAKSVSLISCWTLSNQETGLFWGSVEVGDATVSMSVGMAVGASGGGVGDIDWRLECMSSGSWVGLGALKVREGVGEARRSSRPAGNSVLSMLLFS